MTEALQEDAPYIPSTIDPFALEDDDNSDLVDEEQTTETVLIKKIRNYIDKAIAQHNSFDALHLPQNATPKDKIAVFDEMFNHKGIVFHLRQIDEIIKGEIGEE